MNAIQTEVSDGTLHVVQVGIEFFGQADIQVSLDSVALPLVVGVDYQWTAPTTITFLSTANTPSGLVPNGETVTLRRNTENSDMMNIYDGGAPFSRLSLDENFLQLLRLSQEFSEGLGLTGLRQDLDMHDNNIINLGDPIAPKDAANKEYIDDAIQDLIDQGSGPINVAANVIYTRPSGINGNLQEFATPSGADYVGALLPDGSGGTVQEALDALETITDTLADETTDLLAHTPRLLTTLPEIVAAFPDGGAMRIKEGVYALAEPLVVDYSTLDSGGTATSFPGYVSKRYDIRGESEGNSIFLSPPSDFSVKLLGGFPVTQAVSGFDYFGNVTISDPVRNVPNTANTGGSGLLVSMKAFTKLEKILFQNLAWGLELDGVLTSSLEDIVVTGCYQGIRVHNSNSFSGPNAMRWARVRVASATSNGIVADVGSAAHFDNLVVEGCGTHGEPSSGMVLTAQVDQIGGNVVFNAPYFELNAGEADLYIDNLSASPLVVTINGGLFARAGLAYTKNCIHAHSSGGGLVTVLLKGVSFLSVAGYPSDPSRPYWLADANCRIVADEFCTFNETTSLPTVARRFSYVRSLTLDSAGNIIAGDPTGITVAVLSTGVYQVTTAGTFGTTGLDYTVTANGCDSTLTGLGSVRQVSFQPINAGRFVLNCFNGSGAAVAGPVTMQIASLRGGV